MVKTSAVLIAVLSIIAFAKNDSLKTFEQNSDSDSNEVSAIEESSNIQTLRFLANAPFEYVIQPLFSVAVYPFAQPVKYAFESNIIERAVELITFGSNKNIFIYPTMNLKPGTATMLGFTYRHSNFIFDNDYLVLSGSLYANSDVDYTMRYRKKGLFDGKTYAGIAHSFAYDRDGSFIMLSTKNAYTQTDTTWRVEFRLAHPLPLENTNIELVSGIRSRNNGLPDLEDDIIDSILVKQLTERGVYQDYKYFPQSLIFSYNSTESPFVPTSGTNAFIKLSYTFVSDYKHVPKEFKGVFSSDKNHDYMSIESVFQHYIYFGSTEKVYQFSMKEARKKRQEYSDFSLGETLRSWDPSKFSKWLLEQRVLAMQARYVRYFEVEEGGMPIMNYPRLSTTYPLRGYSDRWTAEALTGLSLEYRWPIDYYVDGVVFLEYATFTDKNGDWNLEKNTKNSWGFGIRARSPDIYFFRVQLGFHGLHGVNLVLTIVPEFQ